MSPQDLATRAAALGALVGHAFRDPRLALAAVCDAGNRKRFDVRAALHDVPTQDELAWVGDAALHLALTRRIFRARAVIGTMSKRRSHLESNAHMAQVARRLGLSSHLLNPGTKKCRPLATAFEALVGAAYVDSGHADAPVEHAVALLEGTP